MLTGPLRKHGVPTSPVRRDISIHREIHVGPRVSIQLWEEWQQGEVEGGGLLGFGGSKRRTFEHLFLMTAFVLDVGNG